WREVSVAGGNEWVSDGSVGGAIVAAAIFWRVRTHPPRIELLMHGKIFGVTRMRVLLRVGTPWNSEPRCQKGDQRRKSDSEDGRKPCLGDVACRDGLPHGGARFVERGSSRPCFDALR